jgi:ketosteroid isomerase-like protein
MTEELRRLYDEWAKGNLLALQYIADPEIEWEWAPEMASLFGGPRVYRGLDEIWVATKEWLVPWEHYWMTADEFIEVDSDRVLVLMVIHGRAHSGNELEQQVAALWTMRDGKATAVRYYMSRDEALEAAGVQR